MYAFVWKYGDKRLNLVQVLGLLGVFLAMAGSRPKSAAVAAASRGAALAWRTSMIFLISTPSLAK